MNLASKMAKISNKAATADDYVSKTFDKAIRIIKEAAMKGNRCVCFYDFCHWCDEGYSRTKAQIIVNKLKEEGFDIKENYVVW